MAIDKTIPNRLQADADQRLVRPEAGEMLDAQNVTMAESGGSSSGVIKNVRGTIAGTPLTATDRIEDDNSVRVIGSVSDSQRGFVYWFVADVTGSSQDAIYQYNTSDDTYRIVLKDNFFNNSFLKFDANGFVKADVLNAAFQQDGVVQTILYFTDNINPPRKVNVDRALDGDFHDDSSSGDKDLLLNSIKAAPTQPPSFNFVTDNTIKVNNFEKTTFQFALQYVYVDGEESAISSYSKLAFPDTAGSSGLEGDESGFLYFTDNVCNIQTYYRRDPVIGNSLNTHISDVKNIRVLGRIGNEGAWFVIDEFAAQLQLNREVYGVSRNVYNPTTGVYAFFNDTTGGLVSNDTVLKLYDDVPLLAQGQSISGNRLMYSNYESGRPNQDISATITPVYSNETTDGNLIISESELSDVITETALPFSGGNNIYVDLDFLGADYFSAGSDVVPGGSLFNINLDFDFDFGFSTNSLSTGLFTGLVTVNNGQQLTVSIGTVDNQFRFTRSRSTEISYGVPEDLPLSTFISQLEPFIDNQLGQMQFIGVPMSPTTAQVKVISETGGTPPNNYSVGDTLNLGNEGDFTINIDFYTEVISTTTIRIRPFVRLVRITTAPSVAAADVTTQSPFQANLADVSFTGYNDSDLNMSNLNGDIATISAIDLTPSGNSSILMRSFYSSPTFKAGCTHELGVVYYDKYNRSGNVNKIGQFYAPTPGERSAGERGAISATVDFTSDLPDWATKYQIVYPGMATYSDFVSYTVGDAFPPKRSNGSLLEERKQLYVSLETIHDYRRDKNGNKDYSFTEGDKLRVIKHAPISGANTGSTSPDDLLYPMSIGTNPTPIEFNVVGVEVLGKDERDNPISGSDRAMAEGDLVNFAFSAPNNLPNQTSNGGYVSSSVTVTRVISGVNTDVTDDVFVPSFEQIKIQNSNTVESMVVRDRGGLLRSGDKLTISFPWTGGTGEFAHTLTAQSLGGVSDIHSGTFIVIDAPQVSAGVEIQTGVDIKYQNFDWFSVSRTDYPDGTSNSSTQSGWGKNTVVEILSPRSTSQEVYYEIGEARNRDVGRFGSNYSSDHGEPVTVVGDTYLKTTSCAGPKYDSVNSTWHSSFPDEWGFVSLNVESLSVSDFFASKSWSKGRPHLFFENSATVRRYNGITYSDAYAEDVANLSLSSFNPSLANFFSLDSANGACNYIGTFRDDYLLAFQENRVARVPVEKDIITSPTTSGIVSLSTNVLNTPQYYSGDFGCGNNPESVLVRDGNAFFVDASRKKLVRLTTEGLSPISEEGVDNMFKSNLDAFTAEEGTRIVSGYDPEDNQYYVTLRQIPDPNNAGQFLYGGLTLGYSVSAGVWQSRYTFYPDMYADQNGTMYSALYVDPEENDNAIIFHSHTNDTNRNTFYGTSAPSVVRVASNYSPSMVKVFNALSLEGDSANWVADPIVTDLNSNAQSLGFVEKEGSYYSFITRDENGTKHITGVGRVASVTASQITFENRVNRNSIPYGSNIRGISSSGESYLPLGTLATDVTFSRFVDPYTIEVEGTINILNQNLVGGEVVAVSEATINGDPVRGHWADITLTNNQATAFELYCVNTHIARSKQDHAAGQQ
jgi:hypothetical protein